LTLALKLFAFWWKRISIDLLPLKPAAMVKFSLFGQYAQLTLLKIAVYGEMKEGILAEDTEFASKALREQLKCLDILLVSESVN
jgi:hypothetical protein